MASSLGDIFFRLPSSAAVLLLSALFGLTNGNVLPRQTKVVDSNDLHATPFHPAPTAAPWLPPFEFYRREDNTICGYIGGDPALPATCSSGSHCVLDAANSVVGCCPEGNSCSTGIFTACVDRNSSPQTEINPYVFTCQGTDVCYKNNFAGGYFQFGCGTASDLGTTVETSASGASTALSIDTTSMSLTELPIPLSTPTTIGPTTIGPSPSTTTARSTENGSPRNNSTTTTPTSKPSSTTPKSSVPTTGAVPPKTSSTTSSSTTHRTSTTWKTVTHSSSPTHDGPPSSLTASPSPTPTDDAGPAKKSRTGAIVGGVLGGAAGIASLVALVFFCLRRRRAQNQNSNTRTGPGPAPAAPPMARYDSPRRSQGAAFAPLPSWNEDDNDYHGDSHLEPPNPYGPLESSSSAHVPRSSFSGPGRVAPPAPTNLGPTAQGGYMPPTRYNPVYTMTSGLGSSAGGGLAPVAEEDRQSSEREASPGLSNRAEPDREAREGELDEFSRAYSNARIGQLPDEEYEGRSGEEDRTPLRANRQYGDGGGGINSGNNPVYEDDDGDDYSSRRSAAHRPLWQQNRQQSRNLMWL